MLRVIKLRVIFSYCYAPCHYAESRNAECRGAVKAHVYCVLENLAENVTWDSGALVGLPV